MIDDALRLTLRMRRGGLALASPPFRAILEGQESYSAFYRVEGGLGYLRSYSLKSCSYLSKFVEGSHSFSVFD
jgi:hypothetical protein